ncbi:rCG35856, partial [Rattus norvegicus]
MKSSVVCQGLPDSHSPSVLEDCPGGMWDSSDLSNESFRNINLSYLQNWNFLLCLLHSKFLGLYLKILTPGLKSNTVLGF